MRSTPRHAAGNVLDVGRQADRRKMRGGARGVVGRQSALARGELERQRHAERHRFAVQQPVGEAAAGFERVAEGVAEIEQRALAALALVARDDAGLGAAADRDGVLARGPDLPPANTSCQLASSQAKNAASPSRPYLATSA